MFKSLTNPMKRKSLTSGASALALSSMTPAERSRGRFMRAPDHDAATGGEVAAAAAEAPVATEGGEAAVGAETVEQVTTSAEDTAAAAAAAEAGEAGDKGGDDADGSIAGTAGEKAIEVLGAPETYEVKAPEGLTFDAEAFEKVAPVLKDLNLSNDAAQRLVDAYAGEVIPLLQQRAKTGAEAAQQEAAATMRREWADEARKDPEIGGANFDQTVDACAQVWGKFGIKKGEGIRQLLDDSGLGNHPDMLRFLSRVAKSTGEGEFVSSDAAGTDNRPVWDRVYGQPEPAKAG